jgi:hypothetical protein
MLKLFVSYSHDNEGEVNEFIKFMAPLTKGENPLLEIWYDRNIKAGDNFWNEIDNHLAQRDIICLFLSSSYLASSSCGKETRKALEKHKNEGVLVIPIIISTCPWLDFNTDLKNLLAVPTDAKPINSYASREDGWMDVYNQIKKAAQAYEKFKDLKISDEFKDFLNDATLLTKAHPEKNKLNLDDVFVNQELTILDKECDKKTDVEKLLKRFTVGSKYVITGEDQSGKSSILRIAFKWLFDHHKLPVYVKDPEELLQGNLASRIASQFKNQYLTEFSIEEFNHEDIVILVDDFHKAKYKERLLMNLQQYKSYILTVDDIFCLDIKDQQLVVDFTKYRIRELKPSLRVDLIKKWLSVRESDTVKPFVNADFERIEELTALVNQSLGKVIGNGIMPAHPFFILYMLSAYNLEAQSGDNPNITSQGHCYQALIYYFLRSHGVDNENVDGYLNFFTEFAIHIYKHKENALNSDEFDDFMKEYAEKFSLVESKSAFLNKVFASGIISISSLNTYDFGYPYLYYFFAGKYFADQLNDADSPDYEEMKTEVENILKNLHKTSNAYIAIFIVHHTKKLSLLNYIRNVANDIYNRYAPATLDAESLKVFGKQGYSLPEPLIPSENSVEENRCRALEFQDEREELNSLATEDDDSDVLSIELRRSIKTVEVIGSIIKNRAGSLSSDQIRSLFTAGMDVHLRLISSFIKLVEVITEEPNYADFLIEHIKQISTERDYAKLQSIANKAFWTINYRFLFSVIRKISQSLGSSKLTKVIAEECDKRGTASSFMVKHTILMWAKKNLQVNELQNMEIILNSPVATQVMKWIIADYCMLHHINYKDVPKLKKLGIRYVNLLPHPRKNS